MFRPEPGRAVIKVDKIKCFKKVRLLPFQNSVVTFHILCQYTTFQNRINLVGTKRGRISKAHHNIGSSHNQIASARTNCNLNWTVSLRKLNHVQGYFLRLHTRGHPAGYAGSEGGCLNFGVIPIDVDPDAGPLFTPIPFQSCDIVAHC